MTRTAKIVLIVLLGAAIFTAGVWYGGSRSQPTASGRRILYYIDPMHPAYKSDKPGIAPDCGMQLEPVYADQAPAVHSSEASSSLPPGAVQISVDRQQAIGVRVEEVRRRPLSSPIRILGRVAPDELRIHKITVVSEGWIRSLSDITTGSLVQKGQVLGSYYTPEFLSAQQAYFYALSTLDRFQASGNEPESQIKLTRANIQQSADSLRSLGMGEAQIAEIARSRQVTQNVRMTAPVTGLVIARNVFPGQRLERGTELFRIADLSRVWVLADIFENESRFVTPGSAATVAYQGHKLPARVSKVPPQFDAGSRTLKVRLELDNPGNTLRPDMFVDVEMVVRVPAAVTVPVDAVLDSGMRKTVFVDRGDNYFEPRHVETGWRLGDRIAVVSGLMPGERIAVSGNFFIDSESRLKLAAAGHSAGAERDPVCGMDVDPRKAGARHAAHQGKSYYFCSDGCRRQFERNPEKYPVGKENNSGGKDKHTAREKDGHVRGPA